MMFLFLLDLRAVEARDKACDKVSTGVEASDYWLHFQVPTGLMPDPQFDGRDATIRVHRVKPAYANGCAQGVPNLPVVLVHGRTIPGSMSFDLRHPTVEDPEGGAISLQEALARSGIDTFSPDLLGYGLSTRFEEGLDDPCNASLPPYNPDGTCTFVEGCDRSSNPGIFPLSQQTRYFGDGLLPAMDGLGVNPLGGERCAHSSPYRFARIDVWVRDIIQVIDDSIEKAQPRGSKVVLLGYSLGGEHVARTLYLLGNGADQKVRRVVFLSSLFNRLPGVPVLGRHLENAIRTGVFCSYRPDRSPEWKV
jgi:pimeloyl-ACP methyl ester carboxylesterase